MIVHNKTTYSHEEVDAAVAIIQSGMVAAGEKVTELEDRLTGILQKKYASALSSGTMALSLALKALGVRSGHEVIIPSYTCSALYHAVKFNNAHPVFADIDEETCNLSPDSVEKKLTSRTRAIIFPHMFGQPGYIQKIKQLGVPVIEDIAQSAGAKIEEHYTGYFGDIAVLSFYATKMLGAGEGGAVLTDSETLHNQIRDMRNYDEREDLQTRYNAKMTNITAAIALAQLNKLEEFISRRRLIYQKLSENIPQKINIPAINSSFFPNYYRLIIEVRNVDQFLNFGIKHGVQFRKPVFKPLHLYKNPKPLRITEDKWRKQISVPLYPKLTDNEIEKIIEICNLYK
ncbi:MAG: DegT/DnrJ/EryC1/StrS family aminotransferase [Candidatus Marinimicrobia bacterium]|nr:DegT/DnrJ/EryC1/StrS family aminotransferase [Candidatus Neomarinimicrobiota bacterium]